MPDRLQLNSFKDQDELLQLISDAGATLLNGRVPTLQRSTHATLFDCCKYAIKSGAKSVVIQSGVYDPDYLAEYNAYYSRQFNNVGRRCVRFHFFAIQDPGAEVLPFLDSDNAKKAYLGFITLRPIARAPVGASILTKHGASGFIKSTDLFPVHIAGVKFEVVGTPFMQQDNAVGACAQASIWMALRTLRKREGDRAHDPAQITGAATRYLISDRTLPNRRGLTQTQMFEAIRAAGYSPHCIYFGQQDSNGVVALDDAAVTRALMQLHPYIESEIPALLVLFPSGGGHAVVAIGHKWEDVPTNPITFPLTLTNGIVATIALASSWTPSLIVHNDNSGPYRELSRSSTVDYALCHALSAIPLLPVDVFMTAEEAQQVGADYVAQVLIALQAGLGDAEVVKVAELLATRLLLLEKRKLRQWAVDAEDLPVELRSWLRMRELPRRIWVLELHLKAAYSHGKFKSLVGLILMDPTGDAVESSVMMTYFNLPTFTTEPTGVLSFFEPAMTSIQTAPSKPATMIS